MTTPENREAAIALGSKTAAEIVARRQTALARRADALDEHAGRLGLTAPPQTAGQLVALGDSWFDYPFHDVLKELEDGHGFTIQSTAKAGDPIEAMAYHGGQLDNFARSLEKIKAQGATPKAVLLSGGGDDIAGKEFGMLLNSAFSPIGGWAAGVVDYVLGERILLAYQTIVHTVTQLCTQISQVAEIPVLVHGYDYPVPDGRGFLGGWLFLPGPWLEPGFKEKLFSDDQLAQTTAMMQTVIDQFNAMLQGLAADPSLPNLRYIDLRGTLSNNLANYKDWWANELHPTEKGFAAVAEKFATVLNRL
jgi:lysophospholipase L1-like esterase